MGGQLTESDAEKDQSQTAFIIFKVDGWDWVGLGWMMSRYLVELAGFLHNRTKHLLVQVRSPPEGLHAIHQSLLVITRFPLPQHSISIPCRLDMAPCSALAQYRGSNFTYLYGCTSVVRGAQHYDR